LKNQNGEDKVYVLDSSAILALFEDENGSETVQQLLEQAKKKKLSIFCNISQQDVITAPDIKNIYEVPLNFEKNQYNQKQA